MPKPMLQVTDAPDNTNAPLDPFDPQNLRLSQSFTETVGVKKLLTTVPVRKPGPQDFVRVHPSREYREDFPIIELKDEREEYIVTAALVPELAGEFVKARRSSGPCGYRPSTARTWIGGGRLVRPRRGPRAIGFASGRT